MYIKYWKNNYYREEGISDIYTEGNNLENLKFIARKLVDRDGMLCAEIIDIHDDEEEVLYFYDGGM